MGKSAENRDKSLEKIRRMMEKEKANPDRVSKWLKVMEYKKKLFALEDQIDKMTKQLAQKKKSG